MAPYPATRRVDPLLGSARGRVTAPMSFPNSKASVNFSRAKSLVNRRTLKLGLIMISITETEVPVVSLLLPATTVSWETSYLHMYKSKVNSNKSFFPYVIINIASLNE